MLRYRSTSPDCQNDRSKTKSHRSKPSHGRVIFRSPNQAFYCLSANNVFLPTRCTHIDPLGTTVSDPYPSRYMPRYSGPADLSRKDYTGQSFLVSLYRWLTSSRRPFSDLMFLTDTCLTCTEKDFATPNWQLLWPRVLSLLEVGPMESLCCLPYAMLPLL